MNIDVPDVGIDNLSISAMLTTLKSATFWRYLVGGLFLPVMLPWFMYRVIFSWNFVTRQRAKLQDKVVLITGASSGLGEALAHEFYKAGSKVILAARRTDELERVKRELIAIRSSDSLPTHSPFTLELDLSDLKLLPLKVAEALKFYGRVDIIVNNGGISYRGDIMGTLLEVDLKVMVVNYFGQVALTKALLPSMIEQGEGHIVSISSVQGKMAMPYRSAYAASKHASQAFFDSLRAEVHDKNIKVTVVSPGYLKTNLSVNAVTGGGDKHGVMDKTTASGLEPRVAARSILRAIVVENSELVLAGYIPSIVILLRAFCPSLYFAIMRQRARQQIGNVESLPK